MAAHTSIMVWKVIFALVFITILLDQSQANAETCRTGCKGDSKIFKYQEGTTYKYNFDSKIEVTLSSAEGQKSLTEIKGTVLVAWQPQCNQVLRLQNVQVVGGDGKKHTNIADLDRPIRLNIQDGYLQDSICVDASDSQNSINIKRAVASLFQANSRSGHETDVFGLCPTDVSQYSDGALLTITRTRNLNRCAYRENIKQDFLATAFNPNSDIKSSPLINGDYTAKLRLKNGILEQVSVSETYLYVPFSVGSNGAKASVETTLKYVGTVNDKISADTATQPRSIILEDPHPITTPHSNVNAILGAVKETAKTVGITVNENTAQEFINLVKIVRTSTKDDLLAVYNQVKAGVGFSDKAGAKKLFLDALLRAGNGDTVQVVIELLKNKELSPVEERLVYIGLNLVRHASEKSLVAVTQLLGQQGLPREAYLGIGSIAGHYCRQHSCKNSDAVNKLLQALLAKLGDGKADTRQKENDIIYTLKAIRNIRQISDSLVPKIVALAQDQKAANRLRVAALETYLADPCKDKLRDSALNILKDIQQDSEVRIRAYLVLVQCPNAKVASQLKTLLDNEPSYQVGGFITTHIRNLRSSANPDKDLARQHFGQIATPARRFPFDLRRYSANSEFSYTVDSLGLASSAESNLIYSQRSYIPRSTSLNLTAEIFGHSFNFLELELRQENLDRLVEHYIGPKGLLSSQSLRELWQGKGQNAVNAINKLREKVEQSLRNRRDVSKAEIDAINKQVTIKTNQLNQDLDLDLSIRAFGSEIVFLNVNDDAAKYSPDAIIDRIVAGLNKDLDQLKNFEETLRSNILFIDAEFAYPTSSGFPLRFGVEGSANIQVKTSGQIDLRALLKRDTTVKFSLIPSTNIQIAGRLTIDSQVVESGLKIISTLQTSTGDELTVHLFQDGIDIKYGLPIQKQNIISLKHLIVNHVRELGASEVNTPLKFAQNKDFSICLDQLSPVTGLSFCADVTGPNLSGKQVPVLPFPLAGDALLLVTIEKEDVSQYHFRHERINNAGKIGVTTLFETLDAQGKPKLQFLVEGFLRPEEYLKVSLNSAIFTGLLHGRIINNDKEKSAVLELKYEKNEYFGKVGVEISGSPSKAVYKPILQYRTPADQGVQVPPYRVEGQVVAEQNGPQSKYTLQNVKLIIPNQNPVTVNGNLGREPEIVFADLTVTDGTNTGSLKGRLQANPNLLKYNLEIHNSINPDANFRVKGELTRTSEELKNLIQLVHGQDLSSKSNILTIDNTYKYRNRGPEDFIILSKNKLTYPLIGAGVELEFQLAPKILEWEVDVQYNDVKWGTDFELKHSKKPEGREYDLELNLWGLKNKVEVKAKRQLQGDQSQISNSINVNGRKFEVNGKIKHHVKPNDLDVGTDLTITSPTQNAPFKILSTLIVNSHEIDISEKITSGSNTFVDAFFKANRQGNANGSIKVTLKDSLNINGQVKANKGTGTADILIELPQAKSSSKLDATFTIHEPTYNVILNLYPLYDQDKAKKITLSTHSKISPQNIDSKNVIDIFGEKLEANVKGTRQGELQNGKINGEADLTLFDGKYFAAKLNREVKPENNLYSGEGFASVEYRTNRNTPGRKITATTTVRKTNLRDGIIDTTHKITAENGNGKDLTLDLTVHRQPTDNNVDLLIETKASGSLVGSPIQGRLKANRKHQTASFEFDTSCPVHNLKWNAAIDLTDNKPSSAESSIELQLPKSTGPIRTIRSTFALTVDRQSGVSATGKSSLFVQSPTENLVDAKAEGTISCNDKESRLKVTLTPTPARHEPVSLAAGLKRTTNKDTQQLQSDLELNLGSGRVIKSDLTLIRLPNHEYKVDIKLDTPNEEYKSNRLQVHTKRNRDRREFQSELIATNNGKSWTLNSDIRLNDNAPSIDLRAKCPDGKLSQLTARINKLTERQLNGDLKVNLPHADFSLELGVDGNVESVDDFHIKLNANSPNLKLDKVVVDVQNKPAKTGRRIQVNAKSAGKNIVQGSTSYTTREDHGKFIVEGSGTFKVRDESQSANFKYIKQNLNQDKNGENGLEISFDAGLGSKAIDAEFKISNKQFRVLSSYCEEKKQCAHVEVDVKNVQDDLHNFDQEIEIAVDLRKLGLSHEFGLKAVTKRQNYILDHTVDLHFQSQENNKYQYSLYFHPNKAGVSLTTPKRILSLEANAQIPQNVLQQGGKVSGEILLYLDKKNQPNQKSGLTTWLNVNPKGTSLDGEARFTNPGLQRPLLATIKSNFNQNPNGATLRSEINLDVFAQPNQKLVIQTDHKATRDDKTESFDQSDKVTIKSTGLGINILVETARSGSRTTKVYRSKRHINYHVGNTKYDSVYNLVFDPSKQIELLFRVLNIDLLKIDTKLNLNSQPQTIDSEIASYGVPTAKIHTEIKNYNTIKVTANRVKTPDRKLILNAGLIPGQVADFRIESFLGAKAELVHATLKLDEANFLKSDYAVNSQEVQKVLDLIRGAGEQHVKELRSLGDEWTRGGQREVNQWNEIVKKATPNLASFTKYYGEELAKIREEILADKNIKALSEVLHKVIAAVTHAISETLNSFSSLLESLAKTAQASFARVLETIEKEILPPLQKIAQSFYQLGLDIGERTVEIISLAIAKISEFAQKYEPHLKQFTTILGEFTQDIGKVASELYENFRAIILEQVTQLRRQLDNLPLLSEIRSEWDHFVKEGLPNDEAITNTLQDVLSTLKDIAPTEELKTFVESIGQYLISKLQRKQVNDVEAWDRISTSGVKAIRSIYNALTSREGQTDIKPWSLPIPNLLRSIPRLGAVRFSPISYLLNEELPDSWNALVSLVNRPRNLVPPFPLHALIAQGQHIFTFDGKHLTFPGKCSYLLARDALDGNFTVVGTYTDGLLSAITLSVGQDSVTLKRGGSVLLNNAATELPARKPNVAAYVSNYGAITLLAGPARVEVVCGTELLVCGIHISGFYHGRIRGLLGNGNGEPYDDFTSANGKIVTGESDFANSYKIGSGCGAVKAVESHHGHSSPQCEKLFGWESSLRLCYPFVTRDNFRTACEHGLAAKVKDTERAIAVAYVAACNQHGIPITVPKQFLKCSNGDQERDIGDTFSVKLPGKAADIVLLVDTVKRNEPVYKEYIQPLVQQLTTDLQGKGITDVEFHLVAYNGENQWPTHFTSNGGKMTFKGKAPNLKFSDNPKIEPLRTGCSLIDYAYDILTRIGNDVDLGFGQDLQSRTYTTGASYPFRAHAVKSIFAVTGNPCKIGLLFPLQVIRAIFKRDKNVHLNLFTPFEQFSTKDAKHAKEIVGFDIDTVFTINKNKGKGSELRKEIDYSDYCVDFTVYSGGNVYNLDNFLSAKGASRKQFVQTAAHSILDQLLEDEQGLDCECQAIGTYRAYNQCKVVHTKEAQGKKGAPKS